MARRSNQFRGAVVVTFIPAALVLCLSACNTNVVEPLRDGAQGPQVTQPYRVSGVTSEMDILWVVDNSFSMCEEQKVLRDNFSEFTNVLKDSSLDFHIALTTTHAPEGAGVIEPVAKEALIQSTPQPVPGNNVGCVGDESNDFAPLRESLEVAKRCLADTSTAGQYTWSTAQISCARQATSVQEQTGCVASSGLPDRDSNGRYDVFDLFPDYSSYRAIPKVLRAEDYRMQSGELDVDRLKLDFSCMATVGTRGDGYEKGLRAAVNAVSRELTGGAVGLEGVDSSAPNHGFIRPEAGFSLIFVTDENDCSHDGSIKELGNACGSNICEYMNSQQVVDAGQSKLVRVADLAKTLRANLAATKGLAGPEQLNEEQLLVASINGTSKRYNEPFPTCGPDSNPAIEPVCESALGSSFSGDRYERFMRQFRNFYPNQLLNGSTDPEATRLDFSRYEPIGWMCTPTFAPALKAIAEFIVKPSGACISDPVFTCDTAADCPNKLYTDTPGECVPFPGLANTNYCTSGVVLTIERNPVLEASVPDIANVEYCLPDSINQLETKDPSCVIDPARYVLNDCAAGVGIQFSWVEPPEVVANKLAGYTLKTVYSVSPQ